MGSMNINFADVESSLKPVPEGTYSVVIERIEVRESKSSDNNYLNWELKITDDDHEDQRLWMITSLSPKALFRLKDVFQALDVLDDDMELEWDEDVEITPGKGPILVNPDVAGVAVLAVVTNEVYEKKERNRVDELKPIGSAPPGAAKKSSAKSGSGSRRSLR